MTDRLTPTQRDAVFDAGRACSRIEAELRLALAFGVDDLRADVLAAAADEIAAAALALRDSVRLATIAPRERAEVAL